MSYPTMDEISWKFTGKPWALNSYPLTPDEVWAKLDLGAEEVRTALNTLSALLGSTSADNWLYQQIANAILDQVADGSLTDVKLSDVAGEIKDRLATQISQNTWTKIAEQTLATAIAQIDFTSIPSGYKNFRLVFEAINNAEAISNLELTFNDDISTNYRYQNTTSNGVTVSTSGVVASTKIYLQATIPASSITFSYGYVEVSNFNPLETKRILGVIYGEQGAESNQLYMHTIGGAWTNVTEEISKISLKGYNSALIGIGSRFSLWGCK